MKILLLILLAGTLIACDKKQEATKGEKEKTEDAAGKTQENNSEADSDESAKTSSGQKANTWTTAESAKLKSMCMDEVVPQIKASIPAAKKAIVEQIDFKGFCTCVEEEIQKNFSNMKEVETSGNEALGRVIGKKCMTDILAQLK